MSYSPIISPDPGASTQQQLNSSSSTGSSFLTGFTDVLASFQPLVMEAAYAIDPGSLAITSATYNATYDGMKSLDTSGTSSLGYTGGSSLNYGMGATSASYLTGGASTSTTSALGDSGNVEDVLAQSYESQTYLIGIQAILGQQQTQFTALSNALNTKHGSEKSVIQNFRV